MNGTRMFYLGDAALANGFRLAGFEVYPDADVATLEQLLLELQEYRQSAFVVLDYKLSECDCQILSDVRREGGRILLSQVPPLTDPEAMSSSVERHISLLLGQAEEAQ